MRPVAVVIPTLRRPFALEAALSTVLAQKGAAELIDEVVVVDNAPEPSARAMVERIASGAPTPIRYVHEPHTGVATARNAGVRDLKAPYVAFIDDDETAEPEWLDTLFRTHVALGVAVTFGPVYTALPDDGHWAREYLEDFFARLGPFNSCRTEHHFGCGNSIMTRAKAFASNAPFDVAADETGGEDDLLFQELKAKGAAFGWAAEAVVLEHPQERRASLAYTLKRAFSYGQTPARLAADAGDWAQVARWMGTGLLQLSLYALLGLVLTLLNRPERAGMADRSARGLGKLVWWVTPKFYGAAALRALPAPEALRTA